MQPHADEPLIVFQVRYHDPQQIVGRPRQNIAIQNFGDRFDPALKPRHRLFGVLFKAYPHEHCHGKAIGLGISLNAIALDNTAVFQILQAAQTR